MKNGSSPNILYIITDQQSAHMMSCAGTEWLSTPNMDRIANSGIRFDRAYCSNPVCIPSRFSLFTGRYPEAMGLRSNDFGYLPSCDKSILDNGMGHMFKKCGYECYYAGKQHFPGYTAEDIGFTVITKDERDELAEKAAEFLKAQHDNPWVFVVSFINPHDICYKALTDSMEAEGGITKGYRNLTEYKTMKLYDGIPDGITEEGFYNSLCPPIPENHAEQDDKPAILDEFMDQRKFKRHAAKMYTENDWRMHRNIYARLTELVDKQIGIVLDALDESGRAEETMIIFTSDHGDMDGSHMFEHKTLHYEEAVRIPLLISYPGKLPEGEVTDAIVSNSIDLYPSLLEYAGLTVPEHLEYTNCLDAAAGGKRRKYLAIESEIGRGIVSEHLKYVRYDFGANNEQLYDRKTDPGEMRNHADNPALQNNLAAMRKEFERVWDKEVRKEHKSPLRITEF